MKNELISIVSPVYNVEKYLDKFIQSILSQTYKNFELLLVLDCPTDNSASICEKYAASDNRIKVVSNPHNMGVAKTRNNGLMLTKGSYIMLADSDDYLSEDALETAYNLLISTGSDISYCGFYTIVRGGVEKKKFKFFKKRYSYKDAVSQHLNLHTLYGYSVGKLYKKDVIKNVKFPEDMSYGEDGVFSFRALYRAKNGVSFTDKPIYYYRIRRDSLSGHGQQFAKRDLDIIKQVNYIRDEAQEPIFQKDVDVFTFILFIQALNKYFSSDSKIQEEFLNEALYMDEICRKTYKSCLFYGKNPKYRLAAAKYGLKLLRKNTSSINNYTV